LVQRGQGKSEGQLNTDPLPRLTAALAGRYAIERELGAGGMATVYLAEDLKHDRKVAIKVLRPEWSAAIGDERFLREIKTTANLRHPHILPLYDSGAADHLLFYVMPYVDGETLESSLRQNRRIPLADALRIAREVADALAYAHAHDVVHRDIKPANILIESGHAVVADFGIARAVQVAGRQQLTEAGMVIGTPSYMSPEQAAGESQLDGRSDLYSLGCVVYEMLAGEPPFTGATAAAVVGKHLGVEPADLNTLELGVPAPVAAIVARLLAKDPAARYPDAARLITALDSVLTPTAIGATAPGSPAAARRIRVATGALVLTAVALGLIFAAYRRSAVTAAPSVTLRQLTSSTEVEEYPALSTDGDRLIFSRDVGGIRQLFLLNIADGAEMRVTRDSSDNIQATWAPDAEAVVFVRAHRPRVRLEPGDVFGEFSGGDIWRRELTSGAEERLVEDASNPAFAADGRLAFDAERGGSRRLWIADARGRNAQQVSLDSSEAVSHVAPRWSPDGRHIVFQKIERTRFDIRVVDVSTRVSHAVTDDGYTDVQPAWDPGGRAIWFSSNRTGGLNVWRMPVTPDGVPSGAPVQMTTGAGQDVELAGATGSERMTFSVLRLNADLWRLPVDPETGKPTGAPEPVVVTTREDSRGAWSPDGSWIAFNSDRAGEMNIWIHSLADGTDRQLTHGPGGDYQPRWSPDGKRIAFFSARAGNADIWSVDVSSGALTQLTTSPWLDINPSFSPDGSLIAFHSDRQGRLGLWLMTADGSAQRELTRNGAGIGHFLPWSPDGKYIYLRNSDAAGTPSRISTADGTLEPVSVHGGSHMSLAPGGRVISDVSGHRQFWVSPLDGTPYTTFALDDPEVRVDYPVWSPDGRWILFDRTKPEGGDIWLMERAP